jgi:hypothetical protein
LIFDNAEPVELLTLDIELVIGLVIPETEGKEGNDDLDIPENEGNDGLDIPEYDDELLDEEPYDELLDEELLE